jgi:VWFA-related protein
VGLNSCVLLSWLATLSLQAQTPVPTFKVPVHLVTAPSLVFSSDNKLISGLQAADFRLYDNGNLEKISLDPTVGPVAVAVAVQVNLDVRLYTPFIAKVGSVVDDLLVGEAGDSAVIAYNSEVVTVKPFGKGDLQHALRSLSPSGLRARALDAGWQAIRLLKQQPPERSRVLLFIGQPMDDGSESTLASLQEEAQRENVTVFALALPEIGKSFVSDTFTLQGPSSKEERGGFKAGTDLLKLITILSRAADAADGADPFTSLTAATGGTQFHFRKQGELEGILAAVGVELRSAYLLAYYPTSSEPGSHAIRVEVNLPGARVRTRPGYRVQ